MCTVPTVACNLLKLRGFLKTLSPSRLLYGTQLSRIKRISNDSSPLAGISTSKQLAENTREQLPASRPVTVHRMDLAKAPTSPVTSDDGQPVILPSVPALCGLSGPGIPLLTVHRNLTKSNQGLFPEG